MKNRILALALVCTALPVRAFRSDDSIEIPASYEADAKALRARA